MNHASEHNTRNLEAAAFDLYMYMLTNQKFRDRIFKMGIGNGQAELLKFTLKRHGIPLESVCEFGAQVPLPAELSTLRSFQSQANTANTAEELYLSLGFKTYTTIDINGEFGALVYDLNKDVQEVYGYRATFDLVTNFGTSEHCFNQWQVFRNLHNCCKVGGYMLHTVPTQGWGGHCFFRYDKNFFQDLAQANNYDLLYIAPFLRLRSYRRNVEKLADVERMCRFIAENIDVDVEDPYYQANEIHSTLVALGLEQSLFNITLACAVRKSSSAEFVTPIQGMYQQSW